jgi:putative transposase
MLITDSYLRKIVGYSLGEKMTVKFFIDTFKDALKNREYEDLELIHHSDRGPQYCSYKYTQTLMDNNIK